jgi:septal ring factor EnvC (AmiA/AmiB activator)
MNGKKLLSLTAALLLAFAVPLGASSQEKLRDIQRRIDEVQARLAASKQEKSSLLNDIYALELQAEAAVIELNKTSLLMADAQEQVERKQKEERALRARIRSSLDKVRRILRVLYKMGDLGYVKLFLNINSVDQLFRNYRLIVSLMDDKVMEIREIRQGIVKLQRLQAELQAELDRLARLKGEKSARLARLRGLKQERLDMIARINRQRDLNSRLLDELKTESEHLTRVLDQKTMASVADAVDLGPLRGRLAWPLRGTVISSFGRKKSAKFDTYTMNNGVEIKPEHSDEIRAVGGGEVIFCDYLKGYGNVLMVQHAGNFHTLYGHCESFLKKPGERVGTGEVIALAGSSGSLYGKALYFEIRQNLKPLDPLLWLAKR